MIMGYETVGWQVDTNTWEKTYCCHLHCNHPPHCTCHIPEDHNMTLHRCRNLKSLFQKGKVVSLNYALHHEDILGSGGIAPCIPNLSTTWRWMNSFSSDCFSPLPTSLENVWAPELDWTLQRWEESHAPAGNRTPTPQAPNQCPSNYTAWATHIPYPYLYYSFPESVKQQGLEVVTFICWHDCWEMSLPDRKQTRNCQGWAKWYHHLSKVHQVHCKPQHCLQGTEFFVSDMWQL
jgi:hypothetical protein